MVGAKGYKITANFSVVVAIQSVWLSAWLFHKYSTPLIIPVFIIAQRGLLRNEKQRGTTKMFLDKFGEQHNEKEKGTAHRPFPTEKIRVSAGRERREV